MAKKKSAAKAKPAQHTAIKAVDDTVELYIPQDLFDSLRRIFGTSVEWNDEIRKLFHIPDGVETCRGIKYCKIIPMGNSPADGDDDDGGVYPIKLCDEGGPTP